MKSTPIPALHPRLNLRLAAYATAVAAAAAAPEAHAAVVYSGPVSIAVPDTLTGVYLDLVTGAATASAATNTGYDFSAYENGPIWFYPDGTGDGVVGKTSGGIGTASALPAGTSVSSASKFLTANGYAATPFDVTGTEYAGIEFKNDGTGATNYGWVELETTATTGFPAEIVGYAYDSSGAPIAAGAVPEPTTAAALGLGALSLGAAGVRCWRKGKQAVA